MNRDITLPRQIRDILSFCLNPSLDIGLLITDLKLGRTNRYESLRTDAGGKGLNVARLLCGHKFDCAVFMPIPEHCHDLYSYLEREQCSALTFEVPGELRINIKINEHLESGEFQSTGINGTGEHIGASVANDLFLMALTAASGYGVVVQSGSLLPGIPENIYEKISEEIYQAQGINVLDSSGEPMLSGLRGPVDIYKPNLDEFRQLTRAPCDNREWIAKTAAEFCRNSKVSLIVVSLGAEGAILTNGQTVYSARIPDFEPAGYTGSSSILSLTGAGDAMTAMLAAVASATPLEQSFDTYLRTVDPLWLTRLVMSAAQAAIRTPGTKMPTWEQIAEWIPTIEVEELSIDF